MPFHGEQNILFPLQGALLRAGTKSADPPGDALCRTTDALSSSGSCPLAFDQHKKESNLKKILCQSTGDPFVNLSMAEMKSCRSKLCRRRALSLVWMR